MRTEAIDYSKHHEMIKGWWKAHRHPEMPIDCLSNLGLVVYETVNGEEMPLVASWAYLSNAAVGWIGWTVSNPKAGVYLKKAIHLVYGTLEETLRGLGYKYVVYVSSSSGLTKVLKRRGYRDNGKQNLMIGRL